MSQLLPHMPLLRRLGDREVLWNVKMTWHLEGVAPPACAGFLFVLSVFVFLSFLLLSMKLHQRSSASRANGAGKVCDPTPRHS